MPHYKNKPGYGVISTCSSLPASCKNSTATPNYEVWSIALEDLLVLQKKHLNPNTFPLTQFDAYNLYKAV